MWLLPACARAAGLASDPNSFGNTCVRQVMHTIVVLGPMLAYDMHAIIPSIVRVAERTELPVVVRRHAIDCIGRLCRDVHLFGACVICPPLRVALLLSGATRVLFDSFSIVPPPQSSPVGLCTRCLEFWTMHPTPPRHLTSKRLCWIPCVSC
jgi:hypothetical protein